MANSYEINELTREESWRLFRIMGEFAIGFDRLAGIGTGRIFYGSARINQRTNFIRQLRK